MHAPQIADAPDRRGSVLVLAGDVEERAPPQCQTGRGRIVGDEPGLEPEPAHQLDEALHRFPGRDRLERGRLLDEVMAPRGTRLLGG